MVGGIDFASRRPDTGAMGVRTRGLDIKAGAAKLKADRAARAEAEAVIQRWNDQLSRGGATCCGRPRSAPGCSPERLGSTCLDRHPLASAGTLVLGLRCSWCPGSAPMPKLLGLFAFPPAAGVMATR
jgi:hypothetical protein